MWEYPQLEIFVIPSFQRYGVGFRKTGGLRFDRLTASSAEAIFAFDRHCVFLFHLYSIILFSVMRHRTTAMVAPSSILLSPL
jgi:hypothetical protein